MTVTMTRLGSRDVEAEEEAVSWVSRLRIHGLDSYKKNNYIMAEA